MSTKRLVAYADLREPTPILRRVPPRTSPVWLRPVGYLSVTVIWFVVFLFAVGTVFFALPIALSNMSGHGGVRHSATFQRSDWVATVAVIMLFAAPTLGVVSYMLLCSSAGFTLNSLILFTRSFRFRYRDEMLSFGARTGGVGNVGGSEGSFNGDTISLTPFRMTRWSKIGTILVCNGTCLNINQFTLGAMWGPGFLFTSAWFFWPVSGVAEVLCAVTSIVFGACFLWVAWQRRHKFSDVMPGGFRKTPYEHSWPNTPPASRTRSR
ncbi:hypothetical protein ACIQPR_44945 [Streptomyces sp. NPDC091280]|uniref:hypothetical protein n=1 Tax=Streptomyces sp. NPDC091280 TaxID=3365984 RepID=UPI00381C94EC